MLRHVKTMDDQVQAIGNRWQAYVAFFALLGGIGAGVTWVVHWVRPFFPAAWGWPEAIAIGFMVTCGLVLLASIFLIAWRYFKPLPQSQRPASNKVPASGTDISVRLHADALAQIAVLKDEIEKKVGGLTGMVSKLQHETAIDLPNASTVGEAYKNLDDAVHIKVNRLSEEIQRFSYTLSGLDRDFGRVLFFATDLATLEVLDAQIQEGSRVPVPLDDPEATADARDQAAAGARMFIRDVRSTYGNSHRGMTVANVLAHAEVEAEQRLSALPTEHRPTHIDVLEYRRLNIIETCRMRLLAFLKQQRIEKECEIRNQRPDLLDRLTARDKR